VDPACRRQLLHLLALPPSICLVGPVRQRRVVAPACPLYSLSVVDPPSQIRLPRARRGPTRAHSRTSPGFSATTPAHSPNSLFTAPPVPCTRPSLHFACPRPLSRSAHAAIRRQRSAPVFPTIQLAGDRAKPPRAPPQCETYIPLPISLIVPRVRPISPSSVLDHGGLPCSRGGQPI
jgi:hypothetical protein